MDASARQEFEAEYRAWKERKQTAVETFTKLRLTKTTFYKLVKEIDSDMI